MQSRWREISPFHLSPLMSMATTCITNFHISFTHEFLLSYSDAIFIGHLPYVCCIQKANAGVLVLCWSAIRARNPYFILQRAGKINLKFSTYKKSDDVLGEGWGQAGAIVWRLPEFEKKGRTEKWQEVAASLTETCE